MDKLIMIALSDAVATTTASAATRQEAASERKWLKYYVARLPEAKQVLHECVVKGFDKIKGNEKVKCEAARDAWHFQQYKSKPATFSSSGGRN